MFHCGYAIGRIVQGCREVVEQTNRRLGRVVSLRADACLYSLRRRVGLAQPLRTAEAAVPVHGGVGRPGWRSHSLSPAQKPGRLAYYRARALLYVGRVRTPVRHLRRTDQPWLPPVCQGDGLAGLLGLVPWADGDDHLPAALFPGRTSGLAPLAPRGLARRSRRRSRDLPLCVQARW